MPTDPGILFATLLGGLSRAMILFLLSSGLSLIFGVMNILNFKPKEEVQRDWGKLGLLECLIY